MHWELNPVDYAVTNITTLIAWQTIENTSFTVFLNVGYSTKGFPKAEAL